MVSSTPRPHITPPGKSRYPFYRRLGGKSHPHRDSIPNRPARSSVAIPTELPGPLQSNVYNLNNVRREANTYFTKKVKEYLKAKIEELENNSKIQNIRDLYRGISDFKKGYQRRTDMVKDDKGDLVTYSHSILVKVEEPFLSY